jgi:imidazolonepropionase-like amidohydrolase
MKTVLSHANLIDCVEPKVRPDCAVLIEDGRIRAILPSGEAGSAGDAQMIDLKGGFLMPGLWDVHIKFNTVLGRRREALGAVYIDDIAAWPRPLRFRRPEAKR